MERDFNNFPPYLDFSMSQQNEFNDLYRDQMFNPIMQYEQAYSLRRRLSRSTELNIH